MSNLKGFLFVWVLGGLIYTSQTNDINSDVLKESTSARGQRSSTLLSPPKRQDQQVKRLSRRRRFLIPGNNDWTLALALTFRVPVREVGSTVTFFLPFTYAFDSGTVSGRRRIEEEEQKRYSLIHHMEDYLSRFEGVDGHACMLRTLCEMAQVPEHDEGLVGDALSMLLAPAHMLDALVDIVNPNEYLRAQKDGRVWDDCSHYYPQCQYPIFQFLVDVDDYGLNSSYQHPNSVEGQYYEQHQQSHEVGHEHHEGDDLQDSELRYGNYYYDDVDYSQLEWNNVRREDKKQSGYFFESPFENAVYTPVDAYQKHEWVGHGGRGVREVHSHLDPKNFEGRRVLSRRRRFLFFASTTGYTLGVTYTLDIPIRDLGSDLRFRLPFTYNFDSTVVTGREDVEATRSSLVTQLESHLTNFVGVDGKACMLRIMCEVSQVPRHSEGFVGDLFNLIISPQHVLREHLNNMTNNNLYMQAQASGAILDDCTPYQQQCSLSLFQFSEDNGDLLSDLGLQRRPFEDQRQLEDDLQFQSTV